MQIVRFSIDIYALAHTVWRVLWDEETFGDWTSAFEEGAGASIRADWREGGRFEFTDSGGGVSYGVIRRLVAGEVVHFEHVGELSDGTERRYPEGPRRAIYTLEQRDGVVRLALEQDVPDEYAAMFSEATPRAFARIRELAESRRS